MLLIPSWPTRMAVPAVCAKRANHQPNPFVSFPPTPTHAPLAARNSPSVRIVSPPPRPTGCNAASANLRSRSAVWRAGDVFLGHACPQRGLSGASHSARKAAGSADDACAQGLFSTPVGNVVLRMASQKLVVILAPRSDLPL